jgi:ketosteroid isomerase-like protein
MKQTVVVLLTFLCLNVYKAQHTEVEQVMKCMQQQENAWNAFDIDAFMAHYWKSDSLMFIGSKGITYGWQQTLDNYKKNYKTPELMGVLSFTNLSAEKLSENSVFIIGKWQIQRKDVLIGGNYTLLWKKINGKWVITRDHTS